LDIPLDSFSLSKIRPKGILRKKGFQRDYVLCSRLISCLIPNFILTNLMKMDL